MWKDGGAGECKRGDWCTSTIIRFLYDILSDTYSVSGVSYASPCILGHGLATCSGDGSRVRDKGRQVTGAAGSIKPSAMAAG